MIQKVRPKLRKTETKYVLNVSRQVCRIWVFLSWVFFAQFYAQGQKKIRVSFLQILAFFRPIFCQVFVYFKNSWKFLSLEGPQKDANYPWSYKERLHTFCVMMSKSGHFWRNKRSSDFLLTLGIKLCKKYSSPKAKKKWQKCFKKRQFLSFF